MKTERRDNDKVDLILNNLVIYIAEQKADTKNSEIDNRAFGFILRQNVVCNWFKYFDLYLGLQFMMVDRA